jgi:hypothetical protein
MQVGGYKRHTDRIGLTSLRGHTTASEPEADVAWDVTEPRFRRPSLAGVPRVATLL